MIKQIQVDGLKNLQTLQGVSIGDVDLGVFTGSIIPDGSTIKEALQSLESEIETPTLLTLDDLTDVGYTEAPSDGEVLVWNTTEWRNVENTGSIIALDTTNFNQNLSAADDTVQKALDTLDNLAAGSSAATLPTDTTNFNGILSAADDTAQKAFDTLDNIIANTITTTTTNFNGILSGTDDTIQKALDTIDDLDYATGTEFDTLSGNFSTHISDGTIHFTQGSISIPASQISNFDTEVSNNTDVTANTAARHTHTNKAYLDVINQNLGTTNSPSFVNATLSGKTAGSVLFAGTSGLVSQDNTNLFWDDVNKGLGLGTNSVSQRYTVKSLSTNNEDSGIGFIAATSSNPLFKVFENGTGAGALRLWSSGVVTTQITGDTTNNYFIGNTGFGGVTSPAGPLYAQSSATGRTLGLINNSSNVSTIRFVQNGTTDISYTSMVADGRSGGYLSIQTSDTERLRVVSSGNVLINTTTDSGYKLDVNGTARVGDHGTASDDQLVNVCYGTSATPPTASGTTEGTIYIQYQA